MPDSMEADARERKVVTGEVLLRYHVQPGHLLYRLGQTEAAAAVFAAATDSIRKTPPRHARAWRSMSITAA
jgi:hypothetical protein